MSLIPVVGLCQRCSKSWFRKTHNKLRIQINNEFDCHLDQMNSEVDSELINESKYHSEKAFIEKLRLLCHDCDKFFPQIAIEIEKEVLEPLRKKVYPDREKEDLEFTRVATDGKVVSLYP